MSRAEPKTDYERGFAQGYEVGWSLAGRVMCTTSFGDWDGSHGPLCGCQPCMLAVHLVEVPPSLRPSSDDHDQGDGRASSRSE